MKTWKIDINIIIEWNQQVKTSVMTDVLLESFIFKKSFQKESDVMWKRSKGLFDAVSRRTTRSRASPKFKQSLPFGSYTVFLRRVKYGIYIPKWYTVCTREFKQPRGQRRGQRWFKMNLYFTSESRESLVPFSLSFGVRAILS